jgi:hypothetical protein
MNLITRVLGKGPQSPTSAVFVKRLTTTFSTSNTTNAQEMTALTITGLTPGKIYRATFSGLYTSGTSGDRGHLWMQHGVSTSKDSFQYFGPIGALPSTTVNSYCFSKTFKMDSFASVKMLLAHSTGTSSGFGGNDSNAAPSAYPGGLNPVTYLIVEELPNTVFNFS